MKKLKRLFVMVMCLICASCTAVFFACDDGTSDSSSDNTSTENTDNGGSGSNTPATATVSSVTISSADNATSVVKGSTLQLTATVTMSNTSTYTGTVTWASDTESVATVSSTGLVTGVAKGTAKITATADSVTSTEFTIEVTEASTPATVSSVTLSETSASIEEEATVTLTATVTMSDNSTYAGDISWESSNTAVATVSGGTVTGVAEGTATITATAGGQSATCAVTVTAKTSTVTYGFTTAALTTAEGFESTSYAADEAIEENDAFTLVSTVATKTSIGTKSSTNYLLNNTTLLGGDSKTLTYTDIENNTVSPTQGIKMSDSIDGVASGAENTDGGTAFTITAKQACTIKVYLSFANDSYNSDRSGIIYYSVNNGTAVEETVSARTTVITLTVDLSSNDVLTIGAINTTAKTYDTDGTTVKDNRAAKLWLFGAQTQLTA